ncbi:hypothetical protein [Motilibacter aurantiacus]|uniref:hypothetical protein n=1 Tax=Motilibacter aurantiacus TaxID=2714955 RepID=UPI0014083F65|nr:hypothetical protein [Motilibacter aurantiacus]NHC47165.1 hypothetical protein [Motilibacter aurantiacus]
MGRTLLVTLSGTALLATVAVAPTASAATSACDIGPAIANTRVLATSPIIAGKVDSGVVVETTVSTPAECREVTQVLISAASPDADNGTGTANTTADLVSGDDHNGVYRAALRVDNNTSAGLYNVSVSARDFYDKRTTAFNAASYTVVRSTSVALRAKSYAVKRNTAVTLTGTLSRTAHDPDDVDPTVLPAAGEAVSIYTAASKSSKQWKPVGQAITTRTGSFTIKAKVGKLAAFKAVYEGSDTLARSSSSAFLVTVTR